VPSRLSRVLIGVLNPAWASRNDPIEGPEIVHMVLEMDDTFSSEKILFHVLHFKTIVR